ncbi:MAG: BCD family MFS transporter [Granulosicoccus sp.]|nr:BCD family MFS transporter [Granulosicoccus sp.]
MEHLRQWRSLIHRMMPFSDAVTQELPWSRLLRLSLFQMSAAMALVLLNGTLNRVMIIELQVPAWLVAIMVALPMLFAPMRALIGFRSDHHRSAIGWRRVPYLWMGSLLQFGGLAIMPFALLLLSGDGNAPEWLARSAAALAFLLVGLGLHTSQTAGLSLATDVAPDDKRPQVVALLYIVLLAGMLASALIFGALLSHFTQIKLIQVIQGAAILTIVFNCIALWKQESRQPERNRNPRPEFKQAWHRYSSATGGKRFLIAVMLGTAGFSMQDILLEPYGAEILGLSVSATTMLTALLATGSLAAFAVAARRLKHGSHPTRVAATGILIGIVAFSMIIFAEPVQSAWLFRTGTVLIGFGAGLFGVSTLIMAMTMVDREHTGLSLGAWGAAQATAAGAGIALGGLIRDITSDLAVTGHLGEALRSTATGYSVVYHLEIALLFAALAALGPLASLALIKSRPRQFGLTEFPN